MPYSLFTPDKLGKELGKLLKKDPLTHAQLYKKIDELLQNPKIGKPLRSNLKSLWRVHVGPFVLKYMIDDEAGVVALRSFEHHDDSY